MRVPGLDLLRGICAVAVAVYHVLYWNDEAKLYTWGTYGVYIFFALSGASMVVAYSGRISSAGSIVDYLLLRLARLMPLYALAMVAGLFRQYRHLDVSEWPINSLFLNLFFLFGTGNPGATSRVVGGWSLGIEFVFYLMFPVFLALSMSRLLPYVLGITFLTQHLFIGAVLGNGKGLVENWSLYTQFLSFIFYFAAGCAIGRFIVHGRLREHWSGLILLTVYLLVLGAGSGSDAVKTLTGMVGMFYSAVAVLSVVAAAQCRLSGVGLRLAEALGKSSYGVYIFHPLLYLALQKQQMAGDISESFALVLIVLASFVLALVLQRYFERPIQIRVKRLISPRTDVPTASRSL